MKKRNNYQKNQKNNAVRESLTRELNRRRNNDVDIKEVAPAVDNKFKELIKNNTYNDDILYYIPVFSHDIVILNTDRVDRDFVLKCSQNFDCLLANNVIYNKMLNEMSVKELMHFLRYEAFVVADITTDFECHLVVSFK